MNTRASSLRRHGRIAGVLYLVVVLSGVFCLGWVPSQVAGGLAAVAAHANVFKAGIAAFLLMQAAFLLLPLALYRVFADLDRPMATVMVALAVVSVPIGLLALSQRMQVLSLFDGSAATPTAAAEVAFAQFMQHYRAGMTIANLFWGLWLLPFGWLVLRSARLPRVFGVLLIFGGIGYVLQVLGGLVPALAESSWIGYAQLPAAAGEIGSCLWLLAFGASPGRSATALQPST